MNYRLLMIFVWLFSLLLNLRAQQPAAPKPPAEQDQDVVRITTNLVQVDVVVTKDGKQVKDLKGEDFDIFEDGKRQTITQFSYVSHASLNPAGVPKTPSASPDKAVYSSPSAAVGARRTIAFVVDDLGLSFESMAMMRERLPKLIAERVGPNDLVAVMRTGGGVGALQQFTSDKNQLAKAIRVLKWNHCSRAYDRVVTPVHPFDYQNPNPCAENALANTLNAINFIVKGMRDLPGRKSMVILSDNFPKENQELFNPASVIKTKGREGQKLPIRNIIANTIVLSDEINAIAEQAIRSSVVIYGIDTSGMQATGIAPADEIWQLGLGQIKPGTEPTIVITRDRFKQLQGSRDGVLLLAERTGGFLVQNRNDIETVMEDQDGYYLIGYKPRDETFNRSFHHIKARVKREGLTVRTRAGFYGVTEDQARARDKVPTDPMNRALVSPFSSNDITVRLTTFFVDDPTAGSVLRSFLFLEAKDLVFKDEADGAHVASLDLSSVVFGDNGSVVSRKDDNAVLRLRGEPYERVMREGVVYSFDTPVSKSGAFQFRVVVRDAASTRMGSSGQFIEVPNLAERRIALSGIVVRDERTLQGGLAKTVTGSDALTRGPAVRKFRQGATLLFGYAVYNAQLNKATRLPVLLTQTRIFRNGRQVYESDRAPLDLMGQTDMKRVNGAARIQLGPQLLPGEYELQVVVDDQLAGDKQRSATQWIDFEVLP
jgi:VWFA-related protein